MELENSEVFPVIGQRLKDLRGKRTQLEVAEAIEGLTREKLSHYEVGRSEPDLNTLNKLADFYRVTTDYLLGRSDYPHMTEAEARSLRTIKDIRRELVNDEIMDVDGKPFNPEAKEEALRQLDTLIKLRELQNKASLE